MASGISYLTAAELSQAAYPGYAPPAGWTALPIYSAASGDGTNSFTTFVNNSTNQIVIAFKGTDFSSTSGALSQLYSDFYNSGGSAWESIASQFQAVLQQIQADKSYAGYQIMTDGHSLGGGMAQTAALEFGLSGYGQNSLPISYTAVTEDP